MSIDPGLFANKEAMVLAGHDAELAEVLEFVADHYRPVKRGHAKRMEQLLLDGLHLKMYAVGDNLIRVDVAFPRPQEGLMSHEPHE